MTVADSDRPESGGRVVLAALLALAFLLGCFPMWDFDVWWHLRTGQLILERGEVPRVDVFTYTNTGRAWIDIYWLFQVGIALLYRIGGVYALVLLKAFCGTATVALALAARRPGSKVWPTVIAWLPAVVLLSGRLCERPELFSLVFLAGFLAILGRAPERPNLLWLLPAIQVLWVNSHGFFILGPLVLGAYVVELLYGRLRARSYTANRPPTRTLAMASGATLVACMLNPYGLDAVRLPLEQFHKLGDTGMYGANIAELKSIGDFIALGGATNPYILAFQLELGLGLSSFAWLLRRGRLSPFRLLLFAASVYLGWQATRNSALFALVTAVVTSWNLDDALDLARVRVATKRAFPAQRTSRDPPRLWQKHSLASLVVIAILGLVVASGMLYAWADEGRTVGFGERPDWYAHQGCAFLARPGMPERIAAFNLGQAAVCIAHTAPEHKLFMDPRLEVNSQETFEHYLAAFNKLWQGGADWETPLGVDYSRPDEIPALLIDRGPLDRGIEALARDPRWRCVHSDKVAVVFVATTFAHAHQLAELRP